jgi:hypothetical protein
MKIEVSQMPLVKVAIKASSPIKKLIKDEGSSTKEDVLVRQPKSMFTD